MAILSWTKTQRLRKVIRQFRIAAGNIDIIESFDGGRINHTYKITLKDGEKRYEYLLQNVNCSVFEDTKGLMENVTAVTGYVQKNGGRSLEYIKCNESVENGTLNGEYIFVDENNNHWRMYHFIEADVYPCIIDSHHAFMLGEAIADFSTSLDGFDATSLIETIPDFHNTPKRFETFLLSIAKDAINGNNRYDAVKKEIKFLLDRQHKMGILTKALSDGTIPYRVAHNDPKLNNVLFDKETNEPICMIDLDTIMPGTGLYDVGDALRSIANTASEDEKTTQNVSFSLEIYEMFVRGYIKGMKGKLTEKEMELIPYSVLVLTLELAMRFLTDHIDGNVYFKTDYDGQNLERARIQMRLAECIEVYLYQEVLQEIVKKASEEFSNC